MFSFLVKGVLFVCLFANGYHKVKDRLDKHRNNAEERSGVSRCDVQAQVGYLLFARDEIARRRGEDARDTKGKILQTVFE